MAQLHLNVIINNDIIHKKGSKLCHKRPPQYLICVQVAFKNHIILVIAFALCFALSGNWLIATLIIIIKPAFLFQWLLSWLLHKRRGRLSVTNLSLENSLPLNASVVIRAKDDDWSIQSKCRQVIF